MDEFSAYRQRREEALADSAYLESVCAEQDAFDRQPCFLDTMPEAWKQVWLAKKRKEERALMAAFRRAREEGTPFVWPES